MTIAYFCIVIGLFIPLACAGYAKFTTKGYNNNAPREFLANVQGKSRRAHHAQLNFYETFPGFIGGVIIAHLRTAPQNLIDSLAIAFIVFRISYALFYIADQATPRSLAWVLSFGVIISLYFIGA